MKEINKALKIDPKYADAQQMKGLIQFQKYDKHNCLERYEQSNIPQPELSFQLLSQRLLKHFYYQESLMRDSGKFDEALELYQKQQTQISNMQKLIQIAIEKQLFYLKKNNYKKKHLKIRIKQSKLIRKMQIYILIEEVLLKDMKEWQQTLLDYNNKIELNPKKCYYIFKQRCFIMQYLRIEKALQDYDKAIKINSDYTSSYLNRALFLQEYLIDQALLDYNKIIDIYPEDSRTYLNRGLLYWRMKRKNLQGIVYQHQNYTQIIHFISQQQEIMLQYEKVHDLIS
ncbi:unnamed protein product [Paramecium sonneborni]|uniref:Tetratricopeptide repeat protein n=1 Tax=Paramecium sonneborni TaxID=65129 RepID=A0A8S1QKS1_9CILI|nr:unnamed protein product [Paramecium sonneborni]